MRLVGVEVEGLGSLGQKREMHVMARRGAHGANANRFNSTEFRLELITVAFIP